MPYTKEEYAKIVSNAIRDSADRVESLEFEVDEAVIKQDPVRNTLYEIPGFMGHTLKVHFIRRMP